MTKPNLSPQDFISMCENFPQEADEQGYSFVVIVPKNIIASINLDGEIVNQ